VRRNDDEQRLKVTIGSIKSNEEQAKYGQVGHIGIHYGKELAVVVAISAT